MIRSLRGLIWLFALFLLLVGCTRSASAPDYTAHNIQGVMPDLAFELTDENGRSASANRYRGQFVVLYFGYTHCPQICPATMGRLRATLGRLPEHLADRIRVLFVSVDPKRDPPSRLASWTANFGPRFVGLTGTSDQLDTLTRRYRVTYSYAKPNASGFYMVNHSSALFVFDPQGRVRLLSTSGETIDALADDLRALARQFDAGD